MSLKVNNSGDRRQVFEARTGDSASALAELRTQTQYEQHTRCPQCNRFGVVSGMHEYYGTIYHCACNDVFWVISPETGEKLEGG